MSTPKKYQFKDKKLKNPKNKNSFIDVLESVLRYVIERKQEMGS